MHQILKARDEAVQNPEEPTTVLNYLAAVLSVVQARCPGDTFEGVFKLKTIFIIKLNCYLPF